MAISPQPAHTQIPDLTVTVADRFRDGAGFAHAGYVGGLVAALLGASAARVSLPRPVPLGRPLDGWWGDGAAALLYGDAVIAHGEPAELELEVPEPVTPAAARAARGGDLWLQRHRVPGCFGCGVERDRRDAIATLPGPVIGRGGLWADTWTPSLELAGDGGRVAPLFLWSALACPTGAAAIQPHGGPRELAVLSTRLGPAPARVGEEHVVMAWRLGREEGGSRGAAALLTAQGDVCAISEGLWA